MSAVRKWATAWIMLIDDHLQVFLFGLMCIGLVLASIFLWYGKITGSDWVAVCGILFGSMGIGGSITQFAKSRSVPAADSGNMRPVT